MNFYILGDICLVKLIIATENTTDLDPPKVAFWEGKPPAISGKSRLVKYYNLARFVIDEH